ncbi:Chymotrypsin-1 [Papilio machaon]|uniref:Chymotrypsin-1 n=1 Tax=Papilio machaon TaxID=76193 RepID=A0A0N0PDI4_PAPMA|nr:Chymotrypsin-1 [Papilio machaon]
MVFKFEVILLVLFVSIFGATSYEYGTSDLFIHAESRGRILGGVPADEGAIPYIAAVAVGSTVRSLLCAGSLFTTKHILTVAHCINALYRNGSLVNSLSITVGTNSWNSGGQTYNISGNITHPDFDPILVINDIGFLIVSTDVDLSKSVQLTILSYENIGAGVETTVAGWGRVNRTTPVSSELLELEMTTVEGQQCAKEVKANAAKFRMRVPPVEPRLMLCAYHSVNHGVCNGDSGSPLVEVSTGKQIGLVSWGMPCALGTPDMFTRVSAYQTWIQQTMTISNNTGAVNETKATET